MNIFYVTFSKNSIKRKEVKTLTAKNEKEAVKITKEEYGNEWDTIYTEEEYRKFNKESYMKLKQ